MLTPGLLPWLAVAGGAGALLRHLIVRALAKLDEPGGGHPTLGTARPPTYPLGTTAVNLVGAAAAGFLLGLSVSGELSRTDGGGLLTVLSVGLLGAFTTFSAWMTEVAGLLEDRRSMWALVHLLAMPSMGVFLAVAGFWIALRL